MARYLPDLQRHRDRVHVVLEQHNVESDFFRDFARSKTGWRRLVADAEQRAAFRFECDALKGCDAVVAISEADATQFKAMAGVEAEVSPVVVVPDDTVRGEPDTTRFCYVGNLRWRPNREGLDWFCQEVWPRIRKELPDATFEIAGIGLALDPAGVPIAPSSWRAPGIVVTGFMQDLEPLYLRSLAVLAP